MGMGRPRKEGSKDLPPGLFCYKGRSCYIKLDDMDTAVSLGTSDRVKAKEIYWKFMALYEQEREQKKAEEVVTKLESAAKGIAGITVADYAVQFCERHLPTLLKKNGEPLSAKTRRDYGAMLENQIGKHADFKDLAIAEARTKHVRQFLKQWIGSPSFYNYMKSLCSRMFEFAVDEGLLEENPVANVRRRATPQNKVVIPMDHYLEITSHLAEWEARACDLIYMVTHNPIDVLRMEDREPFIRYENRRGGRVVVIAVQRSKTGAAVDIADPVGRPGGIEETLQWFRDFKKAQNFVGVQHVIVYPRDGFRRKFVGKPVSRNYLYKQFARAIEQAGFKGLGYSLRPLRKTGLNQEAKIAGKATHKGAHKTEQMREYYVVDVIPQRARNNLTVLRPAKANG